MKLGIREFRERLSEIAHGDEPVLVTHHGKVVGRFVPACRTRAENIDLTAWAEQRERSQEEWRRNTPDWKERLAAYGLGPDGEPLAE